MSHPDPRIYATARVLRHATTGVMLAIPALMALQIARGAVGPDGLRAMFPDTVMPDVLHAAAIVGAYGVQLVFIALAYCILSQMRVLFGLYARGETLSPDCAEQITGIGGAMLAVSIWGVLGHTLSVLILTWGNPPGMRALSINLGEADVGFALAGGLMLMIGWVMAQAVSVAEENRGFV